MEILNAALLLFILVCAVTASFAKSLLSTVIIYSAQSLAMCLVWIFLRAPDLAITEAAVGAGVTSLLFYVALKKIHAIKGDDEHEGK